jgi:glutamine amidotransferase
MCRILGIVADRKAQFRFCLHEAARSLGELSKEHPDGWGIAVYDEPRGWDIGKQPLSAFSDPRFGEVAGQAKGDVLVAHVRRRTVGPISIENTHPFQSGRWVFAHNGTIEEVQLLRDRASPGRLSEVKGTTDSEVFFAYLLSQLDDLARGPSRPDIDAALARAVGLVATRSTFGACNFVLSDGDVLYAFRQGRTLHLLERSPTDEPTSVVPSPETGTVMETRWAPRQRAVLIASEEITDEPWRAVDEGTLLKVERRPWPNVTVLLSR